MTLYSASTGTQYCDLNEIYSKWLIQTKFVLLVRAVVVIQVVMLRSAVERKGCLQSEAVYWGATVISLSYSLRRGSMAFEAILLGNFMTNEEAVAYCCYM